jgi:uncharacterized protein (DUF1697 family)
VVRLSRREIQADQIQMSIYISMLRGINVGTQKRISMESLRGIYIDLGLEHVRTYVQSGNVIFESRDEQRLGLVSRIEAQIQQTCGYATEVFIRQAEELQRILASNPFLIQRNEDPSKLHVTFFYRSPSITQLNQLTTPGDTTDEFASAEMAVYLFCPNGYGKTKLSNSFFQRKLGTPVTTRNWNTVIALYKMALEG